MSIRRFRQLVLLHLGKKLCYMLVIKNTTLTFSVTLMFERGIRQLN